MSAESRLGRLDRGVTAVRSQILVVEDEPDVASLIKHTLDRSGDVDVDFARVHMRWAELAGIPASHFDQEKFMASDAFHRHERGEITDAAFFAHLRNRYEVQLTDEQFAETARRIGNNIYHPVGTCKMGTDTMAVVDPRLRVHGIAGLRVIDASVMPAVSSTNTNAPTIMIAEKGAAMIKASARERPAA